MIRKIGSLSATHPKSVLGLWIVLFLLALPFGSKLQDQLGGSDLSIPGSESAEARDFIRDSFDGGSSNRLILVIESELPNPDPILFRRTVEEAESLLRNDSRIARTESPYSSPRMNLFDSDANRAFIYADLDMEDGEIREYVRGLRRDLDSRPLPGFKVYLTGSPGIQAEGSQIAKDNVATVEKIGLPIVFLLLLIVFRSVIAAMLPLLIGMFTIMLSMASAYPFAVHMELSSLLTNIITMLGLGVAIDYALFITKRFREELGTGMEARQAVTIAMGTAGRAVFFAGATVAISIVSIVFSGTSYARSIALGGSLVVIVSVLVSLTLLPALLTLLDKKINWLSLPSIRANRGRTKFTESFIRSVLKRPILYLIVIGALIGSLFPPVFKIDTHLPVASFRELPEGSESRAGMEAVAEHLGEENLFPLQVLLQSDNANAKEKLRGEMDRVADRIKGLKHVKEVRDNPMISRDGRSAVWIVTADAEASSKQTRQLVKQIREEVLPSIDKSFKGSVAGDTAIGMDYDEVVLGSFPVVIGSVLLLTFLLLYASFRSVLLPLKAIAMNLFVTGSTLGFVVLMYQFGYMPGAEAFPLNINTPLTLFVLLFGLSMDYEVILISRMKERYEATGEHEESIVNGISSTAGMVNGAASIMVVVFGVFLFADFQLIQELGVGLAFAIFVDAWLVRSVLVPVLMKLLGHGNWWGFRAWTNFLIHGKAPSDVTAAKGGVQEGHGLY